MCWSIVLQECREDNDTGSHQSMQPFWKCQQHKMTVSFATHLPSRFRGDEANVQTGCLCTILQINLMNELSWIHSSLPQLWKNHTSTWILDLYAIIIWNRESSLFWAPRKINWFDLNWIITVSLWIQANCELQKWWIRPPLRTLTTPHWYKIKPPG